MHSIHTWHMCCMCGFRTNQRIQLQLQKQMEENNRQLKYNTQQYINTHTNVLSLRPNVVKCIRSAFFSLRLRRSLSYVSNSRSIDPGANRFNVYMPISIYLHWFAIKFSLCICLRVSDPIHMRSGLIIESCCHRISLSNFVSFHLFSLMCFRAGNSGLHFFCFALFSNKWSTFFSLRSLLASNFHRLSGLINILATRNERYQRYNGICFCFFLSPFFYS